MSVALTGFALAVLGGLGALVVHRTAARLLVPVLILLTVSSSALVWLQPAGAGPVGLLMAVGLAARLIPGRTSVMLLTACLSEATVKSHVNHLLPKIGARDRAQAVGYACRHGLTPR